MRGSWFGARFKINRGFAFRSTNGLADSGTIGGIRGVQLIRLLLTKQSKGSAIARLVVSLKGRDRKDNEIQRPVECCGREYGSILKALALLGVSSFRTVVWDRMFNLFRI